jgi:hypothetical protein
VIAIEDEGVTVSRRELIDLDRKQVPGNLGHLNGSLPTVPVKLHGNRPSPGFHSDPSAVVGQNDGTGFDRRVGNGGNVGGIVHDGYVVLIGSVGGLLSVARHR